MVRVTESIRHEQIPIIIILKSVVAEKAAGPAVLLKVML